MLQVRLRTFLLAELSLYVYLGRFFDKRAMSVAAINAILPALALVWNL